MTNTVLNYTNIETRNTADIIINTICSQNIKLTALQLPFSIHCFIIFISTSAAPNMIAGRKKNPNNPPPTDVCDSMNFNTTI